jgi:dipeptidyl aminopeptidase/acylaminoacyl peptidase
VNTHDPFDRRLSDLLVDAAPGTVPDYLDQVRERARFERQRSRWTFVRNWVPFALPEWPASAAARVAWVALLVLLAGVLVVAGLAGSRPPIPAPFGLAGNGLVVYDDGGEILARRPGDTTARALSSGPGIDTRPAVSLDGQRVAFLREQGTERSLVVANLDGSDAHELVAVDSSTGLMILPEALKWDPQSTRIAISVLDTSGEYPTASIWIVDAVSGSHTSLLPDSLFAVEAPAWSPDGSRMAFLGEPTRRSESFLYVADLDGGNLFRLSERPSNPDDGYLRAPIWSPDGRSIATHYGDSKRLDRDILLLATDHRDEALIASTDKDEAQPAWSPDSSRLAFWRSTTGRHWQVVVRDLATGNELVVGPPSDTADSLAWSPDGTTISALHCTSTPECELLLLDAGDPDVEPTVLARIVPKSHDESFDQAYWSWQRLAP